MKESEAIIVEDNGFDLVFIDVLNLHNFNAFRETF
jgi:hypothetical protein